MLDDDVLALDVAEVAQAPAGTPPRRAERLGGPPGRTPIAVDLPRLLRLGGERRSEGTSQRGQQEAAAVHYSIT